MRVLNPQLDLEEFFVRLPRAPGRVLMLDYDGTLAPFHVRPERAVPYPGVRHALQELMEAAGTRVVIVSGRRAEELVPLIALDRCPEIWGGHGWERRLPCGTLRRQEPTPEERRILAEAVRRGEELTRLGARIEHKPASVALHWRGLPALTVAKIRDRAQAAWMPLAEASDFDLLAFDGGLELRAKGCNKRHAVEAVLAETPADGCIAYLGDDLTDEDAFRAVKPRGVAVLVRPELRETAADVWIRPPRELLNFIRRWRIEKGKR
jgi:trehalose 6-phosphate phosphatase